MLAHFSISSKSDHGSALQMEIRAFLDNAHLQHLRILHPYRCLLLYTDMDVWDSTERHGHLDIDTR